MTLPAYTEEVALGNGVQTLFEFSFRIDDPTFVKVFLQTIADGTTVAADSSDYTVAGVGDEDGGSITFLVAPTALQRVIITSNFSYLQGTSLLNQGGFYPNVVEEGMDRLARQSQQLDARVGRSIRGAPGESFGALPGAAYRPNKVLTFDDAGLPIVSSPVNPVPISSLIATQAQAEAGLQNDVLMTPLRDAQELSALLPSTLVKAAGGTHGEFNRSVSEHFGDTRSLLDFSVVGSAIRDGVTDATSAIIAAAQWALNDHGIVSVPGGIYAMSSLVDLTDYVPANVQGSPIGFGFIGWGSRSSIIKITANAAGGLKFGFHGSNVYWQMLMLQIGIMVDIANGPKTFDIFRCNQTGGSLLQLRHFRSFGFDIFGTARSTAITTGDVCNLDGCFRPEMIDSFLTSCNPTGGVDWTDGAQNFKARRIISIDGCEGALVRDCQLAGARTMISNIGTTEEGSQILNNVLLHCKNGYNFIRSPADNLIITGISKANPGVVTYTGTQPAAGEKVFITNVVGMDEVNEREFAAGAIGAATFTLLDTIGGAAIDTTGYTAYVSGGTATVLGATGQQPIGKVEGNHIHFREVGISASGAGRGFIGENDFANDGVPTNGVGIGIWLKNFDSVDVDYNHFSGALASSVNILLDGSRFGTFCRMRGNRHTDQGVAAIRITVGVTTVYIKDPFFSAGDYTKEIDDQTNAVGGANVFAMYSEPGDLDSYIHRNRTSNALRNGRLKLWRDSTSPAIGDKGYAAEYYFNDALLVMQLAAAIESRLDNPAAGAITGGLNLTAVINGVETLIAQTGANGLIQRPQASVTPVNNGDYGVELTDNTHITFKLKGSDGVVRSVALTLA